MSNIIEQIKAQSRIYLKNIHQCLNQSTDKQWTEQKGKWPLWKHFHHLLQSADQWFINPHDYQPPEAIWNFPSDNVITKNKMLDYYKTIETKINQYLNELKVDDLDKCPEHSSFSRLELIMAQMRHAMYHLGYLQHLLGRDETSLIYYGLDI